MVNLRMGRHISAIFGFESDATVALGSRRPINASGSPGIVSARAIQSAKNEAGSDASPAPSGGRRLGFHFGNDKAPCAPNPRDFPAKTAGNSPVLPRNPPQTETIAGATRSGGSGSPRLTKVFRTIFAFLERNPRLFLILPNWGAKSAGRGGDRLSASRRCGSAIGQSGGARMRHGGCPVSAGLSPGG